MVVLIHLKGLLLSFNTLLKIASVVFVEEDMKIVIESAKS